LPIIGIKYLTQLFSAQIILTLMPGKLPNELTSYQPITHLLIVSKIFGKCLLKRLVPMFENNGLISNHQSGFRQRHSTVEQTHGLVRRINEALENKQYYSAEFWISFKHSTKYSILDFCTS
jgi:hypothetical protein